MPNLDISLLRNSSKYNVWIKSQIKSGPVQNGKQLPMAWNVCIKMCSTLTSYIKNVSIVCIFLFMPTMVGIGYCNFKWSSFLSYWKRWAATTNHSQELRELILYCKPFGNRERLAYTTDINTIFFRRKKYTHCLTQLPWYNDFFTAMDKK